MNFFLFLGVKRFFPSLFLKFPKNLTFGHSFTLESVAKLIFRFVPDSIFFSSFYRPNAFSKSLHAQSLHGIADNVLCFSYNNLDGILLLDKSRF